MTNILNHLFHQGCHWTKPAVQEWIEGKHHLLTYQSLYQHMIAAAETLKKNAVQPGDRVILLAESRSFDWIIALFAVWRLQATAVLLDPSLSEQDAIELIKRSDAKLIITTKQFFNAISRDIQIPCLDIHNTLMLFNQSATLNKRLNPDPDPSVACIIFTSGTTGKPHGVMLTHANILFVAQRSIESVSLNEHDQVLGMLPMNHVFGLINIFLSTLVAGGTVTLVSKINRENIIQAIQQAHITTLPATPRLLELFYNGIMESKAKPFIAFMAYLCGGIRHLGWGNPGLKLFKGIHNFFGGNLRRIISGAAPLPPALFDFFESIGWTVIEGYGMTETAGIAAANTMAHRTSGTVGHPVAGVDMMIIHPNAAGEGEICISGPNIMKEYFRDPQSTEEVMHEGWLYTGDLGYLNKNGDLVVSGRIKEIIVTASGKKAMPADIERRYAGIDGVSEMAVIGIKQPSQLGEEIHVAVIPAASAEKEKIKERIAARSHSVPTHLRIQQVHFVNQIPKTATFKVKRTLLKEQLRNQSKDSCFQLHSDQELDVFEHQVIQLLSDYLKLRKRNCQVVEPNASLQFDLGIDSLDRVEIASKMNQTFSTSVDMQKLHTIDKVSDLILLLREGHKDIQPPKAMDKIPAVKGCFNDCFFQVLNGFSKRVWNMHVEGLEFLPLTGPYILCANHQSYLDAYWIFACLPANVRRGACCVARKELQEHWGTALLAQPVSIIPADRDGDALPAIRMSLAVLNKQRSILIFPEGNRSRSGEMRAFRRGAAHLALKASVPIIPIRIEGAFEIYPRHRFLPKLFDWKHKKRFSLRIAFGKPIQPAVDAAHAKDAEETLIAQVKTAIEKL